MYEQIIKNNIKKQIAGDADIVPIILAGVPGIGKSQMMRRIGKQLGLSIVEESLPTKTIESMSGLPDTVDISYDPEILATNSTTSATKWSVPELVHNLYVANSEKGVILLLEDLHAAPAYLQPYLYELLLEKRLGNYKLPEKTAIIGTMNDSTEAGFSGLQSAVRNRLGILSMSLDTDKWLEFAKPLLDFRVFSFLKAKSQYLSEQESTGIEGFGSPRSWLALNSELKGSELGTNIILAIARMHVSETAAKALAAHISYIQAIDFSEIVKTRKKVDFQKLEPLEKLIYPYIVNFISTKADGLYLLKMLSNNINEVSFVGFTIAELSNIDNIGTASIGVKYCIDVLTGEAEEPKGIPVKNLASMLAIAAKYL